MNIISETFSCSGRCFSQKISDIVGKYLKNDFIGKEIKILF